MGSGAVKQIKLPGKKRVSQVTCYHASVMDTFYDNGVPSRVIFDRLNLSPHIHNSQCYRLSTFSVLNCVLSLKHVIFLCMIDSHTWNRRHKWSRVLSYLSLLWFMVSDIPLVGDMLRTYGSTTHEDTKLKADRESQNCPLVDSLATHWT